MKTLEFFQNVAEKLSYPAKIGVNRLENGFYLSLPWLEYFESNYYSMEADNIFVLNSIIFEIEVQIEELNKRWLVTEQNILRARRIQKELLYIKLNTTIDEKVKNKTIKI